MLQINWLVVLLSGLIPIAVRAIWYGPLFGKVWRRESGISDETIKGPNIRFVCVASTLLAILYALAVMPNIINGEELRSFSRGAINVTIVGLVFLMPTLDFNPLEGQSLKLVLVNAGYLIISLALLGGVISGFA